MVDVCNVLGLVASVLFPPDANVVTIAAIVVRATVASVDGGDSTVSGGTDVISVVVNAVVVVGASVVVIIVWIVAAVVLIGATVGMNGYFGQGSWICGPSIDSNTQLMSEPAVKPILYESVIMLPVASFSVAGTFDGANIIGRDPAKPFVMPNAAVNMKAGVSPAMIGWDLGAQHNNSNGINAIRIVDNKINWRLDQAYGTDAITWREHF